MDGLARRFREEAAGILTNGMLFPIATPCLHTCRLVHIGPDGCGLLPCCAPRVSTSRCDTVGMGDHYGWIYVMVDRSGMNHLSAIIVNIGDHYRSSKRPSSTVVAINRLPGLYCPLLGRSAENVTCGEQCKEPIDRPKPRLKPRVGGG